MNANALGKRSPVPLRIEIGDQTVRVADPAMKAIFARIDQLATDRVPVLVTGETGVGKEIIARALHHRAPWASGPFIPVNCGGLPTTLIETELFGHERGAFTGAVDARPGLVEEASGGTLLLDEIGDLPLELQPRLLRLLDRRETRRVGSTRSREVDVRVVAATNRDLAADVAAGRFRLDLFFRLNGSAIVVPPLRERRFDIPVLAQDLLDAECAIDGRSPMAISPMAMFALMRHPWPGNVRELKYAMINAMCTGGAAVELDHLPASCRGAGPAPTVASPSRTVASGPGLHVAFTPIAEEVRQLVRSRMLLALEASHWVVLEAARLLHMPRRTFVARMKQYAIRRPGA